MAQGNEHICHLRLDSGAICGKRCNSAEFLSMHERKAHTGAQRGSPYICALPKSQPDRQGRIRMCKTGCKNELNFRNHTKRCHPEVTIPPTLVEEGVAIPYEPGVAIYMAISNQTGYPVAICVEEAYDENLQPGEISFAEGQFDVFTQMAINMAADQARDLFSELHPAMPNMLATRHFVVSNIPDRRTTGLSIGAAAFAAFFSLALNRCVRMDVAFSGYVFATGEVLGVSLIIEKIVGMSDFGLRKVIVPTGNTAQIYAHELDHPEDFRNVTIMPCGSCREIINAGIF